MKSKTKQSTKELRWVLNKIQTSRALDSRSGGGVVTFIYGNQKEDPSALAQYDIIQSFVDIGAIEILKSFFEHLVSTKSGKKVKFIDDIPITEMSGKTIFPSSIIIKIIEKKFFTLLSKYDIIADEDLIKYDFNPTKEQGIFTVGKKYITFNGGVSIMLQYFYENRDKVNNRSDFKTYEKYLLSSSHDNIKRSKTPNNKEFRDAIKAINKRLEKEFKNIEEVITKTNKEREGERNEYKWKIKFEDI
jgi:hypothetical protein